MIIHESEAKDKRCPFLDGKCVGDSCMAWEWYYKPDIDPSRGSMIPVPKKTEKGYCVRIGE